MLRVEVDVGIQLQHPDLLGVLVGTWLVPAITAWSEHRSALKSLLHEIELNIVFTYFGPEYVSFPFETRQLERIISRVDTVSDQGIYVRLTFMRGNLTRVKKFWDQIREEETPLTESVKEMLRLNMAQSRELMADAFRTLNSKHKLNMGLDLRK